MLAIESNELTKRYGAHTVVEGVSFAVSRGQIFGFLGPNGSGKSTTVKMLCGLLSPTSGTARVDGLDVERNGKTVRRRIGYMAQGFALYHDLTCNENLEFYARAYGLEHEYAKARKRRVIALTGLEKHLEQRAGNLSGGWQRRLGLAAALLHDPPVVFLDEPTSGVDPVARRELWEIFGELAAEGKTFFVTTHDMDEAERCTRLAYILDGVLLACGAIGELCASAPTLEDALVALVRRAKR
jgi:ABC-type multidrug transport system ATPase subunit